MKKYILPISVAVNIVFAVLVIRHFVNAPNAAVVPTLSYVDVRNDVFDKLPVDSGAIIFLGDSQIEHFEVAELFNSVKCKNRGTSGETSADLLQNIDKSVKGNPSHIFIEIGTNDLINDVAVSAVIKNLKLSIDKIHSKYPKTAIYINSVIANKYHLQKCEQLNKEFKKLSNVTHIDLNPYFLDNGLKKIYDSGDGIHLNGAGYLKWKEILLPYIRQ